jgi:cyclic pyranopterin phosphate synthase
MKDNVARSPTSEVRSPKSDLQSSLAPGELRPGKPDARAKAASPKLARRAGQRRRAKVPAALSHLDADGRVRMVDVSAKPVTEREATARGRIRIGAAALDQIRAGRIAKGDPLQTARLAGIMAAKRTADLIPLCHPLPLSHVAVHITALGDGYQIEATARTNAQTGVEMEALTAVSVAALTIYDMVKAVDKGMVIGEIRLISKRGGRSGEYLAK